MKNKNFGRKRQAIYILSNRKSTRIIKTLMDFFFFIKVKIKMVCFSVPSYEMDVVQKRWFPSFTEFIDHKDQIRCYPVQDGESLARYLVQEVQLFGEVHPDLLNHIDYAAIGRELETSENYLFTDNGIFYYR